MAKVLVIHGERGPRKFLEARASVHHEVKGVKHIGKAIKEVNKFKPELMICEIDPRNKDAMDLLRHLKRNRIDIPVVLVGNAAAGVLKPMAMKIGAAAFVEYPMEQAALDQAMSKALQDDKDAHGTVPPITDEEKNANISEMEKQLNRHMECFAGKNQVFIQSVVRGVGSKSKPRIALKCKLRKEFGYPPDVYYEYIRDVCCDNPGACPAYQAFKARNSA